MDQNTYMEAIKKQVWRLSKDRREAVENYWKLVDVTKQLYADYQAIADVDKWKDRLEVMGLVYEDPEPEPEPEEIDHEAVTNYAFKCAETYEKAHPGDRKTVEEFLGSICTWEGETIHGT